MKRILMITGVIALSMALLVGCAPGGTANEQPADEQAAAEESAADMQYAFEFKDLDGNTHKLSDYAGKPVYLKVWASWCTVCTRSLPETEEASGSVEDYHYLTVISPDYQGEMPLEDFKAWYAELEYENIVVLVDENQQIIKDFGVQAFPSQVFFDTEGNFAGGRIGLMSKEQIATEMEKLA